MAVRNPSLPPPAPRRDTLAPSLSIDYRALLFRYKKNWYWFVLAAVVFSALAYVHLRYAVPQYATSATIIVEDPQDGGGVSTRQLSQQLGFYDEYNIGDELNLITSRDLMAEVVRQLGLDVRIVHKGRVRDTDLYNPDHLKLRAVDTLNRGLEDIEYGSARLVGNTNNELFFVRGENDSIPYTLGETFLIGNRFFVLEPSASYHSGEDDFEYVLSASDPVSVASGMTGRLRANQVEKGSTVRMSYTDTDPQRAADVLNTVITVYNQRTVTERSQTGEQTVAFLDERLDFVSRELYSVEASVAGLKARENMVTEAATRGANYLEQLNAADAQIAELEVRKSLINQLRQELNAPDNEYRPLSVASEIIDGTLTLLVQSYNQLIFERDQKLEVATPDNPAVVTYSERINELRRSLRQSVETIYRETNERARRIADRMEPIEARMNQLPENERRLVQVLRQQKIKESLFVYLMEKREEAALTVAAQIPNTRIVDEARPNGFPISPKPRQTYVMALALALLLPGIAIFLQEAFNTRVQAEKEVLRTTGVPVVGRIAKSSKNATIVVSRENRSGVAEMFRLLRTNLSFEFAKFTNPVVLLTSGVSGEGKTFVTANLGYILALGSKRTVVIGADLRKPRLGVTVRGDEKKRLVGLSNYLIGEAEAADIVKSTDNENLFVIESGPIPPNPSELLLRDRMAELITYLKGEFDVILIDTAPVGLVTDALLLKPFVDISLYVVRLGYTPKQSLEVLTEISEQQKLPNVGVVLNGLQPKRDYGYGYAQGYYQ